MGLKIRLRQQGRTNRPFYRLVVTACGTKRDGKYVESLGWYNPIEAKEENRLSINAQKIDYWLNNGAQLTEKAKALVKSAAPELIRKHTAKEQASRVKAAKKKRELRNKKEAAKA